MSYETAIQTAMRVWKCNRADVIREILTQCADEDMDRIATASSVIGTTRLPEKHTEALIAMGGIVKEIVEGYLADNFGASWMDGEIRLEVVGNPDQEHIDADNRERVADMNSVTGLGR